MFPDAAIAENADTYIKEKNRTNAAALFGSSIGGEAR